MINLSIAITIEIAIETATAVAITIALATAIANANEHTKIVRITFVWGPRAGIIENQNSPKYDGKIYTLDDAQLRWLLDGLDIKKLKKTTELSYESFS